MSYETMEKEGVARRGFVVVIARAVESEVPIFDSGQFQLSDSYSNPDSESGSTPTFSCISYLK